MRSWPGLLAAPAVLALVLTASPAVATSTVVGTGGFANVTSDDDGDTMLVTCNAGVLSLNGASEPGARTCDSITQLASQAFGGNDVLDLQGLTPALMPMLAGPVTVDLGLGTDTFDGGALDEHVTAGDGDTVRTRGGDDVVVDGASIDTGSGDDRVSRADGTVDLGPGDDVIEGLGAGPIEGGTGEDAVVIDFGGTVPVDVDFVITDVTLTLSSDLVPATTAEVTGFEQMTFVMPGGTHLLDFSAYSGTTSLTGGPGADDIRGGSGDDVIAGGAGKDAITGGRGYDFIRSGRDDDTVSVRDGLFDRVTCGEGDDTVTADRVDAVAADCETVLLPPPSTSAVRGPAKVTKGATARFTFTSSVAGSTFQCRLDAGPWRTCRSPYAVATRSLSATRAGKMHTLAVRAAQPAGNVDPTPSVARFKVATKRK